MVSSHDQNRGETHDRPANASIIRRVACECPGQINLFGEMLPKTLVATPAWQSLPKAARAALTSLMTRLILDHVRASGRGAGAEAGHDC